MNSFTQKRPYQNFCTNARYFPFEARKGTHEQRKTKIDIDEFRSRATNITLKGIHNTVADTILQLEYDPKLNKTNEYTHAILGVEPERLSAQQWKSFENHWRSYNEASMPMQAPCFHMNEVFANCSDKDKIYPLTTMEIAAAQWADVSLKHLFKRNAVIDQELEIKLTENSTCVCKDGRLVIPKPLQVHAVKWYHHYLQHPGHTHLKEMMNAAMYWKGMRTTIRSLTKSCKSCQINKRRSQKYGHLPPKTVYTIPWECLCVVHTLLKAKITCR